MSVRDRIKMFEKAPSATGSVKSFHSGFVPPSSTKEKSPTGETKRDVVSFLPRAVSHSDAGDQHTPKSIGSNSSSKMGSSTASVGKRGTPPSVSPSVHQPVWKKAFDVPAKTSPAPEEKVVSIQLVVQEIKKVEADVLQKEEEAVAVTEAVESTIVEDVVVAEPTVDEPKENVEVTATAVVESEAVAAVVEEVIVPQIEEVKMVDEVILPAIDEVMAEKSPVKDSETENANIISDSPMIESVAVADNAPNFPTELITAAADQTLETGVSVDSSEVVVVLDEVMSATVETVDSVEAPLTSTDMVLDTVPAPAEAMEVAEVTAATEANPIVPAAVESIETVAASAEVAEVVEVISAPTEVTPAVATAPAEAPAPVVFDPLAKNPASPDEPIEVTPEVIAAVKKLNENNSIDHTTLLDKPLFPKPPLYTE